MIYKNFLKLLKTMNDDKVYTGIYISATDQPQEIKVQLDQISDILQCYLTDDTSCGYMNWFGYRLVLFWDSAGTTKKLPYNSLATGIAKSKHAIHGPAILIDDQRDITLDQFQTIIKIAELIPTRLWMPEIIKLPFVYEGLNKFIEAQQQEYHRVMEELKINRLSLWDQLKDFIPPE